jgi:SAM-dependent methyltransferase
MLAETTIFTGSGYPVLQNRTFGSLNEALESATGEIVLKQDPRTGIVHNVAFDPELVVYDTGYDNEQGHSVVFRSHLNMVGDRLARELTGKSLLEVGCGKGLFLKLLRERGFEVIGVDPSYTGDDRTIVRDFYSPNLNLRGDAIVLRHVLEHIPDPIAFLDMLRTANGGGLIYIEVPCLEWIAKNKAWFDIFYEHVNYFRISDLTAMFGRVLSAEHVFGGQYIGIVADLGTLQYPAYGLTDEFRLPAGFSEGINVAAAALRDVDYAVWGAASKGVIFSLHMRQRQGPLPRLAIDVNRSKQGRYMPVSGVGICSPDDGLSALAEGTTIVVMNNNYLDEIRNVTGNRYKLMTVTQ